MKNRFGLLIAAAISMACFSLPSVADVESVTPAGFYQVEVTPQALGEMDAITAQAAIEIQAEQSLEAMAIGPGSSNVDSGSGDSPTLFARTNWPDGSGAFAKIAVANELSNPFEVGWREV